MSAKIKSYDSAYPNSMRQRSDGCYLQRNDHVSLAAGLLELIASRDREIAELRKAAAAAPDLLAALRDMLSGWTYIRNSHGDLYGVGWDRAQEKAERAIEKATGEPA